MSDTRTIKILTSTVCGGVPVAPGAIVEASVSDARYLVNTGSAEPHEAVEEAKPARKLKNKMIDDLETRELRG